LLSDGQFAQAPLRYPFVHGGGEAEGAASAS